MSRKNSDYTFNLSNNTIYFSRNFENLLNSHDADAYKTYLKLKKDFPSMTIAFKPKAPRKSNTQVTYRKMELYINCFRDAESYLNEFRTTREASKAQPSPYNFVRDWFMETFPNYKQISPDFDANGKIILLRKVEAGANEVQVKRDEKASA